MKDIHLALNAIEFDSDLNDDDLVIDAVIVMRVQDDKGHRFITTAVTDNTDDIVTAGMLTVLDQVRDSLTLMRNDL